MGKKGVWRKYAPLGSTVTDDPLSITMGDCVVFTTKPAYGSGAEAFSLP